MHLVLVDRQMVSSGTMRGAMIWEGTGYCCGIGLVKMNPLRELNIRLYERICSDFR